MTTEFNFLESKYIKPVREAGGVRFLLKRSISPTGDEASVGYSGPFAVSNTSSGSSLQATVAAGSIIAGITKISVPATPVSISSSCYIYVELTYSSSVYSAEIKTSSSVPSLSSTAYRVVLASVTVEDSKIKKIEQQWQYGDIYVAGRFV